MLKCKIYNLFTTHVKRKNNKGMLRHTFKKPKTVKTLMGKHPKHADYAKIHPGLLKKHQQNKHTVCVVYHFLI